jgi:hypothetical protein
MDRECTRIRCREGDARLHLMTDDRHCSDGADGRDPEPEVEPHHAKDRGSKVTRPIAGSRSANIIIKDCTCRCRQSSGWPSGSPLKSQGSDGIGCLGAQGHRKNKEAHVDFLFRSLQSSQNSPRRSTGEGKEERHETDGPRKWCVKHVMQAHLRPRNYHPTHPLRNDTLHGWGLTEVRRRTAVWYSGWSCLPKAPLY